ncbi:inositol monophosphatase family protein [Bacillus taeanensis]|uniref:Inositol monophosphatase n=1 Tax=Bacillus taeanensis TaxID=273032 RepID=A0A366XU32_9BACI|nr:inositol monophosphatase family protein [Bacillus taeanensis]RBW69407.1 inositol monophosphatase [Bacillus taeanensis]
MKVENWNEISNKAMQWTKEAGEIILSSFSEERMINFKSNPSDLVTDMDQKTEQFFIEKIKSTYPTHKILGEEGFGDEVTSQEGTLWIIDPIDGTMNFVHQQRNFAISIGIYQDGVGKVGIIYDVVAGELFHCIVGSGAYLNEVALPKLNSVPLSEAVIGLNSTWVTENKRIDAEVLAPLVKAVRGTRSYGSAAIEMAYVASGRLDAYMTLRLSPWDFAAGILLIQEVSGVATNLYGKPIKLLQQNPVFVGKPVLHDEILHHFILKQSADHE